MTTKLNESSNDVVVGAGDNAGCVEAQPPGRHSMMEVYGKPDHMSRLISLFGKCLRREYYSSFSDIAELATYRKVRNGAWIQVSGVQRCRPVTLYNHWLRAVPSRPRSKAGSCQVVLTNPSDSFATSIIIEHSDCY